MMSLKTLFGCDPDTEPVTGALKRIRGNIQDTVPGSSGSILPALRARLELEGCRADRQQIEAGVPFEVDRYKGGEGPAVPERHDGATRRSGLAAKNYAMYCAGNLNPRFPANNAQPAFGLVRHC